MFRHLCSQAVTSPLNSLDALQQRQYHQQHQQHLNAAVISTSASAVNAAAGVAGAGAGVDIVSATTSSLSPFETAPNEWSGPMEKGHVIVSGAAYGVENGFTAHCSDHRAYPGGLAVGDITGIGTGIGTGTGNAEFAADIAAYSSPIEPTDPYSAYSQKGALLSMPVPYFLFHFNLVIQYI